MQGDAIGGSRAVDLMGLPPD
ncbi:protein of unknown function [Candidatus Filomicrobium marinum]|uniref:Uncharacterized protein n=1 Tax=Candidatus Filomicrobium marinum TaxID=1608628 RepID=A0A0D6JIH0_9HYPH|nr:protein of unknown function [Candidatus Filomicrobium marinum]CPR21163.1 protein of unknown function [Candidatus Filomicrobium marinum]